MKFYNVEKIVSKSTTEYIVNLDGFYVYDFKRGEVGKRRDFDELSTLEQMQSIRRKERYYRDKIFYIRRLVDCNYDDKSSFLTITFKENITDVKLAHNEFEKFMKRLKRYLKRTKIKYIATWERQKRGAVHYHIILFDVPFMDVNKLEEIWGNGFVKINQIAKSVKQWEIGVYLTKYFVKDIDKKERYSNAYSKSRGLIEPIEYKQKLDLDAVSDVLLNNEVLHIKKFKAIQVKKNEFGREEFCEVEKLYVVIKNNTCKNIQDVLKLECNTNLQENIVLFKNKENKKELEAGN
jgi:hypothetical protein